MKVRTKKYQLDKNNYIKLSFQNILREQWWVFLIAMAIVAPTFITHSIWFAVLGAIGLIGYLLFWLVQFYGVTYLEQTQLIFQKVSYEITSHQILVQLNPKQGIPIGWDQIKRARHNKDAFILLLSKAHMIHLPHKIFQSAHEIKFLETLLKRKKLL